MTAPALYLITGECLYCSADRLATTDHPPRPGSPVFCGMCAALHLLDVDRLDGEWAPRLRRPTAAEREPLLRRDDVRAVRDAYRLDQIEARMAASSGKDKGKRPSPPRTAGRVRLGPNRLEARGPDA